MKVIRPISEQAAREKKAILRIALDTIHLFFSSVGTAKRPAVFQETSPDWADPTLLRGLAA